MNAQFILLCIALGLALFSYVPGCGECLRVGVIIALVALLFAK